MRLQTVLPYILRQKKPHLVTFLPYLDDNSYILHNHLDSSKKVQLLRSKFFYNTVDFLICKPHILRMEKLEDL